MIYFAYCGSLDRLKIGTTTELKKRLSALQTGCPEPLELIGTIPGGRVEEAALHREFQHLRLKGEWFRGDEQMMERIRFLVAKHRGPKLLVAALALKDDPLPLAYSRDLDFFADQGVNHPLLCYLTSKAVGHKVSVFSCQAWAMREIGVSTVEGDVFYQVMRWNSSPGPGLEFWDEHLWERPQWFTTPEAACAAYVASFCNWGG